MFSLTGEIDTAVVFCEYDIVFWMGKCSPSSVSCTEPRLRLWILLISFSVPAHWACCKTAAVWAAWWARACRRTLIARNKSWHPYRYLNADRWATKQEKAPLLWCSCPVKTHSMKIYFLSIVPQIASYRFWSCIQTVLFGYFSTWSWYKQRISPWQRHWAG